MGLGWGWGQGWGDSKHHERERWAGKEGWARVGGQGVDNKTPQPGWPVDQFTVIQPS